MINLHAIWHDGGLDVLGRRSDGSAIESDELGQIVGDCWDALLVSGSTVSTLALRIPTGSSVEEAAGAHQPPRTPPTADGPTSSTAVAGTMTSVFNQVELPTLRFAPAEAVDLLATAPRPDGLALGSSFLYWKRVAGILLELLASQRFVPAIHEAGTRYRGYWRIVIADESTSERLRKLISSMPPVCRSVAGRDPSPQASDLVENFLWTSADAIVRHCLDGDELVHITHGRQDQAGGPSRAAIEMQWLRSLVSGNPTLEAPADDCRRIHQQVYEWTSKLEPAAEKRSCRTCLQLHAPIEVQEHADAELPGDGWRLSVHVQATDNPALVVDAAMLWEEAESDPRILQRPFANAREHVINDLQHAVRHFPPLAPCLEPGSGMDCWLSLADAYTFLRDVAPVLKLEDFGIWLPRWWRDDRPRLQLQLEVRPLEDSASADPGMIGLHAIVAYDWRMALGDIQLSPEEIDVLANARDSLVRLRGEWIEVQPDDLKAAMQFAGRHRQGRMTVLESLRHCYLTEHHETGLPISGIRAHGWIQNLLESSTQCDRMEQIEAPAEFHGELRPYQLTGLQWLAFLTKHGLGACLADDMGLGKTIQLIALWLHERKNGQQPGPTLLIVPMSLVGNWRREIERFAPELRVMVHHGLERLTGQQFIEEVDGHDVVISTYGLTHRDFDHLAAIPWFRVALDEAQNIKNPAAKQSKAIRSLRAVHRIALTGTPVENRLSELWAIVEFLNSSYLGSARDFRRRFAVPIERERDPKRAKQLRRLIQPFVLRRKKDDPLVAGDLPPKMEMKVFCNLTREQAVLYERVVSEMLGQIEQAGGIQRRGLILATLTKLKQVCNHPVHFLGDQGDLPHRSGKSDRLSEMLEEVLAEGDRALVFTQFREMGHLLQRHLREAIDCDTLFLHGGTTQKQRDRMVLDFQDAPDAPPVFLLSLKAGGFGLNLTRASHVFHFDRWWNPAVEDQATDRAHRIGQHKQVQVHRFVCVGTLEEKIDALINRKRTLAENIVGSGEDWLTELSTDALREIFALSRDAVAED
ncbi:MAG: DEAD/DEAH box helicase [Planctomycetota bacterium]|jgi:superfamily II DNA or RNA helicase